MARARPRRKVSFRWLSSCALKDLFYLLKAIYNLLLRRGAIAWCSRQCSIRRPQRCSWKGSYRGLAAGIPRGAFLRAVGRFHPARVSEHVQGSFSANFCTALGAKPAIRK